MLASNSTRALPHAQVAIEGLYFAEQQGANVVYFPVRYMAMCTGVSYSLHIPRLRWCSSSFCSLLWHLRLPSTCLSTWVLSAISRRQTAAPTPQIGKPTPSSWKTASPQSSVCTSRKSSINPTKSSNSSPEVHDPEQRSLGYGHLFIFL